jgi:lipopolysaccharide/colanic/teichoic acid biosynthesis glycosyltransferase
MVTSRTHSNGALDRSHPTQSYGIAKRCLDVVVSGLGLLVLSPVLLAIGVAIRVAMGRPVLFSQLRPGLGGRPFRLYKFRTMVATTDDAGDLLPDGERITALGAFLRRSSLDELPELWNVVRGDMSLVGPRPLLMEYLDRYNATQARRHEVRPGLTGLAQVEGRNALPWDERFELDVTYVDSASLRLDLAILLRTVPAALRGRGISEPGHATARLFGDDDGAGDVAGDGASDGVRNG